MPLLVDLCKEVVLDTSNESACLQSASMQDSRIAVVERALISLAHLTEVGGGDFLRRRMQKEAWPLLSHLLKQGLSTQNHSRQAGYLPIQSSEAQAPAISARVRLAVVTALDRSVKAC